MQNTHQISYRYWTVIYIEHFKMSYCFNADVMRFVIDSQVMFTIFLIVFYYVFL